uniref:Uncharacterized protein n=1 Tax=Pseudomonas phage vB_PaeP_FBPa39 TaxID=3231239 RepID=A0AAU8KSW9_9VIRU
MHREVVKVRTTKSFNCYMAIATMLTLGFMAWLAYSLLRS